MVLLHKYVILPQRGHFENFLSVVSHLCGKIQVFAQQSHVELERDRPELHHQIFGQN